MVLNPALSIVRRVKKQGEKIQNDLMSVLQVMMAKTFAAEPAA